MAVIAGFTSCDSEKDLIIIDGDLPIKTSTLYMVGSATPSGWDLGNPTSYSQTDIDPLVFEWTGTLNIGEIKLCLHPGSWDDNLSFIRPLQDGEEINSNNITNASFQMHAGDPDEKWHVTEAGEYQLTFDLRNWTMSTSYLKAAEAPSKEPILTDVLYIVGDATPSGWNIDSPTLLNKTSDFIFEYEGELYAGEIKACTSTGDWNAPFIRPESEGVQINKEGVEYPDFMYVANPDNKWRVNDSGIYHLTFDLENYTIKAVYEGEIKNDKYPIETETLYMIGDATPGGWSMDDATPFMGSADNKYIFTWEGNLVEGNMKACLEPDPTFSCPFLRPQIPGCEISSKGVADQNLVYTVAPDDQWKIVNSGTYKITFDLENWTINVACLSADNSQDNGKEDDKSPLETETLYMIGDATPGGWSMDDATAFTVSPDNQYIFSWVGDLVEGEMKVCFEPDGTFSCPFIRPSYNGCVINENGVASSEFEYSTNPDNKWKVEKAGKYNLTFNLKSWTFEAAYLD